MRASPEIEHTAAVPEDLTGRPRRVATGGVSWRRTFSAFQHRNYRLYFLGQLVSLIGTWMTSTAQGWLVYQLTGSKALLGIVSAAGTAPMLVFSTWGGWAADHFPKRSVLSASSANVNSASKNACDWPLKSPVAVGKEVAPVAAPFVSVGRMIEQTRNFRSRNMVGSGMIRLVWKSSPPNGGLFRSGNTNPLVGSVSGGAMPALSCQV